MVRAALSSNVMSLMASGIDSPIKMYSVPKDGDEQVQQDGADDAVMVTRPRRKTAWGYDCSRVIEMASQAVARTFRLYGHGG